MAHTMRFQQTVRKTRTGIAATIRAIVRWVAAEHTLAQRAASRAGLALQNLDEVRAMYVSTRPTDDGGAAERSTKSAR